MNPKRFLAALTLIVFLLLALWLPVNAAPTPQQTFSTPTPGQDGRIVYIVQPGDSCFRVAALHSITEDQLRQLNKLDESCTLIEGQELLVGVVSLAGTPTAGPSPIPAPPTPTPTPFTGTTEICVLLFEDTNGNSLREETEPAIPGGAVSVTEINGEYSASQETILQADPEAFQGICFSNVPQGEYNLTVAIPDNFNATMELSYALSVNAGDRAFVNFGAQSRDVVVDPGGAGTGNSSGGTSAWMALLGGLLLLGGAGLGYYAWRSGKPESKLAGKSGLLKR